MKTSPPEPLDHHWQIDERSSCSLIENTDKTGQCQASPGGGFSRIPIIDDHLIHPELFGQKNRFALA